MPDEAILRDVEHMRKTLVVYPARRGHFLTVALRRPIQGLRGDQGYRVFDHIVEDGERYAFHALFIGRRAAVCITPVIAGMNETRASVWLCLEQLLQPESG